MRSESSSSLAAHSPPPPGNFSTVFRINASTSRSTRRTCATSSPAASRRSLLGRLHLFRHLEDGCSVPGVGVLPGGQVVGVRPPLAAIRERPFFGVPDVHRPHLGAAPVLH